VKIEEGTQLGRPPGMFYRLIHPAQIPHVSHLAWARGIFEASVSMSTNWMYISASCTSFGTLRVLPETTRSAP